MKLKLSFITTVGHAVGRDAFLDHKMIVPLSELVRFNSLTISVCCNHPTGKKSFALKGGPLLAEPFCSILFSN